MLVNALETSYIFLAKAHRTFTGHLTKPKRCRSSAMGTLYGECCCPAHCIETRPGRWNQSNTGGCDLAGFKPAELLHDDNR